MHKQLFTKNSLFKFTGRLINYYLFDAYTIYTSILH